MSNIIKLTERKPTVLSCTYYIHVADGWSAELTGDELFSTTCPECGAVVMLDFREFISLMSDGDLFGTMVFATDAQKRGGNHERQTQGVRR